MMRLVLLGAPGSGKGTQGERIAKRYNIPQLSTGEILREAIRAGTPLGKKAAEYMNRGELVPDALILEMMSSRIDAPDCSKGYILDGFPRTIEQAEGLDRILAQRGVRVDAVINIDVPETEIIRRLGGRRTCRKCGAIFHNEFSPSKNGPLCDKCGGELYRRDDDKDDTIKNRIRVYKEKTAPLLEYYKDVVKNIGGSRDPADVFNDISSLIDKIV